MSILVTGGCGFIGSNFIRKWLNEYDEKVINLDNLTYAGSSSNLLSHQLNSNYSFIKGNIGDSSLVTTLLNKFKPRAIINFAAESHVDRSIETPDIFIENNVLSSFKLIECAKIYWQTRSQRHQSEFRFINISTDEVFGSLSSEAPAFTENHCYQPNSPYSASKASFDHIVRSYYHTYGFPAITCNCSNNYGPYQHKEKLIPKIILNALSHKPIPIYGDGQQIRDWLYVADHCDALCTVLKKGSVGETYNIGGSNEETNLAIAHKICDIFTQLRPLKKSPLLKKITRYHDLITHVEDRAGHDTRYAIDAGKISTQLGWFAQESLCSGLAKTISWYLDNSKKLL